MNLDHPTNADALRELVAAADDDAGSHVLWVDGAGDVRLTRIDKGDHPDPERLGARVLYAPFEQGQGQVGTNAATDAQRMDELHSSLRHNWDLVRTLSRGTARSRPLSRKNSH